MEAKANEALLDFVAEKPGIHRRKIVLIGGQKSRDKLIENIGIEGDEGRRRLTGVDRQ